MSKFIAPNIYFCLMKTRRDDEMMFQNDRSVIEKSTTSLTKHAPLPAPKSCSVLSNWSVTNANPSVFAIQQADIGAIMLNDCSYTDSIHVPELFDEKNSLLLTCYLRVSVIRHSKLEIRGKSCVEYMPKIGRFT